MHLGLFAPFTNTGFRVPNRLISGLIPGIRLHPFFAVAGTLLTTHPFYQRTIHSEISVEVLRHQGKNASIISICHGSCHRHLGCAHW